MESSQHLRFATRQLWRNPGFTVTVIITLALSIGANTAIFSLVNALMLKSLPYAHPEWMSTIYESVTGARSHDERTLPRGCESKSRTTDRQAVVLADTRGGRSRGDPPQQRRPNSRRAVDNRDRRGPDPVGRREQQYELARRALAKNDDALERDL